MWGNNLVCFGCLVAVARRAHLHVDQRVRVSVVGGQVIITPVNDVPLTLSQTAGMF